MEVGLFFGSFNPIHTGHLIIAQHLLNRAPIQQVWLVVSPHNPLKDKTSLANDYDRLHLAQLAVEEDPHIKVSNIEFSLPKPSYTIDTLTYLKEKYPHYQFSLIMGGDNLVSLPKWKNHELILRDYRIYVYRRPGAEEDQADYLKHPHVTITEAPLLDLSSTYIRNLIREGKSVRYMVPEKVYSELELSGLYKSSKT